MMTPGDIERLAEILRVPEQESSSSEEDLPKSRYAKMGPGDIGKRTRIRIKGNEVELPKESSVPTDPKSIWDISEVPEIPVSDDSLWDPREKPKYDITYKQAVKTEDLFLQLSNKTPTTASCESLIIVITMDGENKSGIDCDVTKTNIDIRSPKYRLNLPLPHPVDPDTATAEWHCKESQLIVCLQMNREYDFLNF